MGATRTATFFDRNLGSESAGLGALLRRRPSHASGHGPRVEDRIERDSRARLGRTSQNDGRADGALREGGHEGARDREIEALKQEQARLEREATKIEQGIKELEGEIKQDESSSNAIGTAVGIATAPIGLVAGLFGRKNPVAEAAKSVSSRVLGLESQRSELLQQRTALASQRAAIAEQIEALEHEQTLNLLADVAHVTGMPQSVASALEGAGSVDVEVVESTGLGSDAAYDATQGSILVDEAVIERARASYDLLLQQGIIDEQGNIIDEARFDASTAGDALISTTALIGVHEMTHAAQDNRGGIDEAQRLGQAVMTGARMDARMAPAAERQAIMDAAYVQAELQRIDLLEYDAYTMQESLELQAGKQKQGFITINPDGSLLPREQAVENIFALTHGLPIPHGVSAGTVFGEAAQAATNGETPGKRTPGKRTPGDATPGKRTPGDFTPGELTPGKRTPGKRTPGKRTPGIELM